MCNGVVQWGGSILSVGEHSSGPSWVCHFLNLEKPTSTVPISFHFSHFRILPTPPSKVTDVELWLLRIYRLTNLRKRQNFKQFHENRRLRPSITMGCFKCRHQKSYLMDWSRWSYDGFCQCHTGCCSVFICWAPIRRLSVVLEYSIHMLECIYIWSWGTIYRSHDTNHIQGSYTREFRRKKRWLLCHCPDNLISKGINDEDAILEN